MLVKHIVIISYIFSLLLSLGQGNPLYGCDTAVSERTQCLYTGITEADCKTGGCCYSGTESPACYLPSGDTLATGFHRMPGLCGLPGAVWYGADSRRYSKLCRRDCINLGDCPYFRYSPTKSSNQCKRAKESCPGPSMTNPSLETYSYFQIAAKGFTCMRGSCKIQMYDHTSSHAQLCGQDCKADLNCLGFTFDLSTPENNLRCIRHRQACGPQELDLTVINAFFCQKGPVVEGLAWPGTASIDLVDGSTTTCLDVPFTSASPHYLKLRLGMQKLDDVDHTFSLVVKGLNLKCDQSRTTVYGTTVHAPEELGVQNKGWKQSNYPLCSLVSAEVLEVDVCTFACDCGTHCGSVYVSVLTKHPAHSWGIAKVCEIEVT